MKSYIAHTARLAEATPPDRNRVVDFWRAAAIAVVVIGHWLAASIWLRPDGEISLLNSLEWVPYAGWITWLVQVMPVFFLAGGYANGRALAKVERGEQPRRHWITVRGRRLFAPVIPLLVVWVGIVLVMRPFVSPEVVRAGAMSATVPLWFLAVYIALTALAPFTLAWWRRSGLRSVVVLVAMAVAVDVLRFVFAVPGVGWVNFVFVWAAVHQLGYWWLERDLSGGFPSRRGAAIMIGALAALVAVTWVGWYPVAMLGVPGAGPTNMTPPTAAMFLLGLTQAGAIWASQAGVARLTARRNVWHGVVALSGVMMTVYLWHLTAMSLVGAVFLNVFDGVAFSIEPGTGLWWVTRPLWLAGLGAVTAVLVALFARFEWRVPATPLPHARLRVTLGVLLAAGAAAAVASSGLVTSESVINWSIPLTALLGAWLLGALPSLRPPRPR